MSFFRIVLIIAVGVAVYWLYKKRGERAKEPAINLEWQVLFRRELPELKNSGPAATTSTFSRYQGHGSPRKSASPGLMSLPER